MDTIAINTRFLEWDMIALAKAAGELKKAVWEDREKLEKQKNSDMIKNGLEELLLMQEELWLYIQNMEVIQRMYEGAEEELVSITQSLSLNNWET
ncbi:MAG: hypothetical protein HFJ09_01170 [Lachnospiraceae bacterium]|nr:hypothetical protein [Lachnospiraceae bacterium]